MARHSKEYNDGYQAAIEAIKKAMQGQSSGQGSDGEGLPSDMTPPPSPNGQQGNQKDNKGGQGRQSGQGSQNNSRTDKNNSSQGIVRPEDCVGSQGVEGMPKTPGGFFSKSDGDKLAEKEGYDKEGGNEGTVEKDWKEAALKATEKMQGDAAGNLKSTIEGLYKSSKDWKKDLRNIVGRSINAEDKRQAYANKNILVSQDRIARTDKDKYDNMDYMIALVDSSGSMSDEQLKMCLTEVYSVALAKKPIKLFVIQCDTRIQEIKEYKSIVQLKKDIIHATVKGRGGTDFKAFWDLLKTDKRFLKVRPDLIMIFTDGYVDQIKRDRKTMNHLCWCIIDNTSFKVENNDAMTRCIHIKSADIK